MLTVRQKQIKDFVDKSISRKNIAPTEREIAIKFKISPSTAHEHLESLQEKGYLEKAHGRARGIKISNSSTGLIRIPLLGIIAAGEPIEVLERGRETIAIPKSRFPSSSEMYALRVQGDSMSDENVHDGDTILIHKQNTAENGDKVVALVNGNEATLKTFYKEKGHIRLQPANKNYEPIIIKKGIAMKILGVVFDIVGTQ